MEEFEAARYWCHVCFQVVNPIVELEVKCPFCQSGFVEEMSRDSGDQQDPLPDLESDGSVSLWAPILLEMMSSNRRRRRSAQPDSDGESDNGPRGEGEAELEPLTGRRRRSSASASFREWLQNLRSETAAGSDDPERERRGGERVVVINPFNQTIIIQGPYDPSHRRGRNEEGPVGWLGDYFIGPGFESLLQHLAENDPNRYGTPPARKEAVEAMPAVRIDEDSQCSVCLEDFERGAEAREMPCKHRFHGECILPWLELHSSCPVCRSQMPAEEAKSETAAPRQDGGEGSEGGGSGGRGRRFSFLWPLNGLFSSLIPQSGNGGNSSSPASSSADSEGDGHP